MSERKERKEEKDCSKANYNILMIGTSGVGKSCLASTLANKAGLFPSGLDYSLGMTKEMLKKDIVNGKVVVDTPGLFNTKTKVDVAQAIWRALLLPSKGETTKSRSKIFVVVNIIRARLTAEDYTAVKLVLRSVGGKKVPFCHLVINQIPNTIVKQLTESTRDNFDSRIKFAKCLAVFGPRIKSVIFVPQAESINKKSDQVLPSNIGITVCNPDLSISFQSNNFMKVVDSVKCLEYELETVVPIQLDDVEATMGSFKRLMTCFSKSPAKIALNEQKERQKEVLEKQLVAVHDAFHKKKTLNKGKMVDLELAEQAKTYNQVMLTFAKEKKRLDRLCISEFINNPDY